MIKPPEWSSPKPDDASRVAFIGLTLIAWLYTYVQMYALKNGKILLAIISFFLMVMFSVASGSRTYIGIFILITYIAVAVRFKYFAIVVFCVLSIIIMVLFDTILTSERYTWEYTLLSWLSRNGPFISAVENFSFKEWLVGRGFGELFYIPWFALTDFSLYLKNVDGLYQTLIVKIGLLGTFMFAAIYLWMIYRLSKINTILARSLATILFIQLLMALTTSFLFQAGSVLYGLPVGVSIEMIRRHSIYKKMLHNY